MVSLATEISIIASFRLQLHGAIYRPDSFVLMQRYCANLKEIRYESTRLNRIVADKSHRVIVALLAVYAISPNFFISHIAPVNANLANLPDSRFAFCFAYSDENGSQRNRFIDFESSIHGRPPRQR